MTFYTETFFSLKAVWMTYKSMSNPNLDIRAWTSGHWTLSRYYSIQDKFRKKLLKLNEISIEYENTIEEAFIAIESVRKSRLPIGDKIRFINKIYLQISRLRLALNNLKEKEVLMSKKLEGLRYSNMCKSVTVVVWRKER